jgi:hypothetical protein
MATNTKPKELDPAIAEAVLRGLSEDIAIGRVEVHAFEKITYKGGATTLIVNFEEKKGETGGKTL